MELLQSLLSNFGSLFLVIFFFGSSIFVHELGHFLAARRRGLTVERFSIGFGPKMFGWRGKDGVEYCLCWLPLGGYVRLPQLADLRELEGDSNTADVSDLPAPSYLTKLIVFLAGAVFNLIFAFLLASVLWVIGFPTTEDDSTTRIGYVVQTLTLPDESRQPSPASKADIRPGDVLLAIDGTEVRDWAAIQQALFLGSGRTADGSDRLVHLKLQRGDQILEKDVNPVLAGDEKFRRIGISAAHSVVIGQVAANSVAAQAGLQPGDRVTQMGTEEVLSLAQFSDYLKGHAAETVPLEVERNAAKVTLSIPPQKNAEETLAGVTFARNIQLTRENPVSQFKTILASTFRSMAALVNPRSDIGLSKMSGPIGIVNQFWLAATSSYPVRVAIWLTILINISLAVFNLLPIPVLDGGHILFATIAKLRGRALPADFIQGATSIFIVLLFSMILYVSYNDVRRLMRDRSEIAPPPPPPSIPAPAAPAPVDMPPPVPATP